MHTRTCFKPSMQRENVEWKGNFYKHFDSAQKKALQVPIFLVDFVILDFGLWSSAL